MRKMSDIASAIVEQISESCQCSYRSSLIIDSQLFCDDDQNKLIYQAQFLKFDRRNPNEIRGLLQDWVLTKPFVLISNKPYKFDSSCSVIVQTLGNSTCIPSSTTGSTTVDATSYTPSSFELATIAVVGLILLLIILVVTSLTVYFVAKRSKKKKNAYTREDTRRFGNK